MKLATWKRTLLAGLLTLSVAGGSLAPVVAGHVAAAPSNECTPANADCGVPRNAN